MKIKALIEILQHHERLCPDAEVYIEADSHDYWKSKLALQVQSVDFDVPINYSEYHKEMKIEPDLGGSRNPEEFRDNDGSFVPVIRITRFPIVE